MHCQICGFENTPGVNFCKRCGTVLNINALSNQTRGGSPLITIAFLIIIGAITIAGFSLPVAAFSELHDKINQGALNFFAMVIIGATVGIDALLINLFTKYLGLAKFQLQQPPPQSSRPKYNTSGQEYSALPEPPYVMHSVTENTTRNFEPIPEKRPEETT